MLTRFINTEATEVNDRIFRFKISDDRVDRHNSVLKPDGWMLDNYNDNGIVSYNHLVGGPDPDMVIGKGRAWLENGSLYSEVEFEPEGMNPVADKVVQKLRFGTLKKASVGFDPMLWSRGKTDDGEDPKVLYFRKQDLLEWGVVDIPANVGASVQKAYGDFVEMALAEGETPEQPIEEKRNTQPAKSLDKYRNQLLTIKLNTL